MDEYFPSDRAAEKQKVRELIRDAVRILIQSSVSHHTKLSIEALFGITIDDGEDSIIFSINECVGADEEKASPTEEQYENAEADASYCSYNSQFDDSVAAAAYGQQYKPAVPYQAVVKKEVISYNVGQQDAFPQYSVTSNRTATQYLTPGGSYSGYQDTDYGHRSVLGVGGGQKVVTSGLQRGRGRGPVLKRGPRRNETSARSLPTVKQEHGVAGGEVDTTVGGKRNAVDDGEVSHVTLYTCQRCGKQMTLYSSFLRHKKSHLGIIYRCDGCGKICSRSDHLKAHQRNCPAALQQAPLD